MAKKENTVSYTTDEMEAMRLRGESKSDWARANAMAEAELEAAIADDPDEAGLVFDWSRASVEMPKPKAVLNIRVDQDVLDFFRQEGRGYQTRINAVLRSYVDQMRNGQAGNR
jgi:uncharacterized protein (DUF4415 family)